MKADFKETGHMLHLHISDQWQAAAVMRACRGLPPSPGAAAHTEVFAGTRPHKNGGCGFVHSQEPSEWILGTLTLRRRLGELTMLLQSNTMAGEAYAYLVAVLILSSNLANNHELE